MDFFILYANFLLDSLISRIKLARKLTAEIIDIKNLIINDYMFKTDSKWTRNIKLRAQVMRRKNNYRYQAS